MKLPKINAKQQLVNAGIGTVAGLTVKYAGDYLAKQSGNPQLGEITRRAANVAAAYGGKGTGELAYQIADAAINHLVVVPSGGMALGTEPGESA